VPIINALAKLGVDAFAPEVDPYNTVPNRARQWKGLIETILSDTGHEAVHLIGFSLISVEGGHRFVSSLTTVATPHRGSTLASYILERPEAVRSGLTGIAEWMGRHSGHSSEIRFLGALEYLTPEYVTGEFNASVADVDEVQYYSFAGRAGKDTGISISPVLVPGNRIIFASEGINDGFVSIRSARWTGFQGCVDADHGELIGLTIKERFDAPAFYCSITETVIGPSETMR
jgi:triacylglycerol lipase